jgi:hypothetical protein
MFRYQVYELTEGDPVFLGTISFPVPVGKGDRIDLSHRAEYAQKRSQWMLVDRITVYPSEDDRQPILDPAPPLMFIRPSL